MMPPANPEHPVGLLLSGGLDSGILLYHLLQNGTHVQPIYIRTQTVWQEAELAHVRRLLSALARPSLEKLKQLEMPLFDLYGEHWSLHGRHPPAADSPDDAVYLPGRNALLLVKAAIWCKQRGIAKLALAPLATNPFGDTTPEFFDNFTRMINCSAGPALAIIRPFAALHKRDVMELGRGAPWAETFSCIAPVAGEHCGECNKCGERQAAFRDAALPDPTRYAHRAATPHVMQ